MVELNSKEEKKQFYRMVCTLVLPMALQNLINVGAVSYTHLDVYKRQFSVCINLPDKEF